MCLQGFMCVSLPLMQSYWYPRGAHPPVLMLSPLSSGLGLYFYLKGFLRLRRGPKELQGMSSHMTEVILMSKAVVNTLWSVLDSMFLSKWFLYCFYD